MNREELKALLRRTAGLEGIDRESDCGCGCNESAHKILAEHDRLNTEIEKLSQQIDELQQEDVKKLGANERLRMMFEAKEHWKSRALAVEAKASEIEKLSKQIDELQAELTACMSTFDATVEENEKLKSTDEIYKWYVEAIALGQTFKIQADGLIQENERLHAEVIARVQESLALNAENERLKAQAVSAIDSGQSMAEAADESIEYWIERTEAVEAKASALDRIVEPLKFLTQQAMSGSVLTLSPAAGEYIEPDATALRQFALSMSAICDYLYTQKPSDFRIQGWRNPPKPTVEAPDRCKICDEVNESLTSQKSTKLDDGDTRIAKALGYLRKLTVESEQKPTIEDRLKGILGEYKDLGSCPDDCYTILSRESDKFIERIISEFGLRG